LLALFVPCPLPKGKNDEVKLAFVHSIAASLSLHEKLRGHPMADKVAEVGLRTRSSAKTRGESGQSDTKVGEREEFESVGWSVMVGGDGGEG
jgi:hypothetical protein